MNKERYNQIIDEVYKNYKHYFENKYGNYITGKITKEDGDYLIVNKHPLPQETILSIIYSKEEFIRKCKTDSEFSEKCGLKIVEETIFDIVERIKLAPENNLMEVRDNVTILGFYCDDDLHSFLDKHNVPRKFVTYYYKDEKIEVYE